MNNETFTNITYVEETKNEYKILIKKLEDHLRYKRICGRITQLMVSCTVLFSN
jgi:hypothetical protein